MTRINVVPPSWLADQHLVAEAAKELPRMYALINKWKSRVPAGIPKNYLLGTGHLKFFHDKMDFIILRHHDLLEEARRRGFKLSGIPQSLDSAGKFSFWIPSLQDEQTNLIRLNERLIHKPGFYKYYGKPVRLDFYNCRINT